MGGCFDRLAAHVHHYEGTINQFTGDGIMALFGAPIAHEDHAIRALQAALDIQAAMRAYSDVTQQQWGMRFQIVAAHRILAEMALSTNAGQADIHFSRSIDILREIRAEPELALAYAGYGRLRVQQGDVTQARRYLRQALEIFERLDIMREPERVRVVLAGLPEG